MTDMPMARYCEINRLRALVSDDTLQQIRYIRNSAIEECARVAETYKRGDCTNDDIAAAIRALKEKTSVM